MIPLNHSKVCCQLLLLLSGDIELCPGPDGQRLIPELASLLKEKGMHIFHQNVRGLFSNKDYIVELMESFKKLDIFTLSETHLQNDITYGNFFEIPGYDFINRNRMSGTGGGVGAYIKGEQHKKIKIKILLAFTQLISKIIFP